MSERKQIRVRGRVQGVGFRASARAEALRLGLSGFARNEPDGTVLIEAEGPPAALARFVAWCRRGPGSARVTDVVVCDLAPVGGEGFGVG